MNHTDQAANETTLLSHPKTKSNHLSAQPQTPLKTYIGLFLIVLLILSSKNEWNEILYPVLFNEDGSVIFAQFLHRHHFQTVFERLDPGYLHILPYLFAYIVGYLPVEWIPSSYAISSLLISAFTFWLFFPVFERLGMDRWAAYFSVIFLALLPLGNAHLSSALSWQHYNAMIILFLLQTYSYPKQPYLKLGYMALINGLIWSHPLSILAVPVYLFRTVKQKEYRVCNGLCMLSAISYYLFGSGNAKAGWSSLSFAYDIIMERVVLESLVGPQNRAYMQFLGASSYLGMFIILATFLAWVTTWKKRSEREKLFLAYSIFFIIGTSLATTFAKELDYVFLNFIPRARFVFIPKVLFVALIIVTFGMVIKESPRIRAYAFVLMLLLIYINGYKNRVYDTDIEDGKRILSFAKSIAAEMKQCTGSKKILVLDRGTPPSSGELGGWSIIVEVCD